MCEAIRELVEDGKKEGLQIGIEQGLGMAKDIFRLQKTGSVRINNINELKAGISLAFLFTSSRGKFLCFRA